MKFIFGFAIIAAMVPGYWMACKSLEELDQCAYEISFLSNHDIKVPSNDADVVAGCNKAKAGIKCLHDQTQECLKSAAKPMIMKVMGDLQKHLNTRCDSPKHRAEFLKHVQCFTDKSKADAIRLCADKHVAMLEKVASLPAQLRLGGGCCSGASFKDCSLGKISELCSGETGDYFMDMINEVTEESVNMICQDYISVDRCDSKYDAAAWTDLKAIAASDDPAVIAKKHHFKTALPVVIKMLKDAMK